jgi:acetyl/propionyl-CoA carboxylase alpha subunit
MRLRRALGEIRIMGVKTNIPFHQQLIQSTRFQAGQFDTRFVEDRFAMQDEQMDHAHIAAAAATLIAHKHARHAAEQIGLTEGSNRPSAWKRAHRAGW